jgi:hypothetical protein
MHINVVCTYASVGLMLLCVWIHTELSSAMLHHESGTRLPIFRRSVSNTYQTTLLNIPEDRNLHSHCCENVLSLTYINYVYIVVLTSLCLSYIYIYQRAFHVTKNQQIKVLITNINDKYEGNI